jgi:diguanylate cyclase (GGDEF)-like protein
MIGFVSAPGGREWIMDQMTERGVRATRALARASNLEEICEAVLDFITSVGLRGAFTELRGDELRPLGIAMPDEDLARVEEVFGAPLTAMRIPIAAYKSLSILAQTRRPTHEEAFPSRLISMFPHLNEAEKASARRHMGAGPLFSVPIEAGDSLRGVLLTWGPTVMQQRALVESIGAQAGLAWRGIGSQQPATGPRSLATAPAANLAAQVRDVISPGGLRVALQPVVRLTDRTVLGYEALCRFVPRPGLQNPDDFFSAASAVGLEREVQAACVAAGFAAGAQIRPATLFVNVSVETLVDGIRPSKHLARVAGAAGIAPADIVLEVSERSPIHDLTRLRRVVADLRREGFRVAIDDAGAGHASMLVIAEVQPEFVKVDYRLIHGVDTSAARRALVVSLLSFGAHINARVIAEGIESEAELQTLLSLGVTYGQGFHLGRPAVVAPAGELRSVVEVGPTWFADQPTECFPHRLELVAPAAPVAPTKRPLQAVPPGRQTLSTALINAAAALQSEHDPITILSVIAEQLQRVVRVDAVTIYAVEQRDHRFVPVYATGLEARERMAHSFSMDVGLTGWAFASAVPQRVEDVCTHAATTFIPGTPVGAPESMLLIPLIAGERQLGMLNCSRLGAGQFSAKDLEAAALFGNTAAAAWRNAELYAELADRATTDPLTGLLNSRWLRDVGERELAQSRRSGRPLSVLLIDLDHFKQINDSGGHGAGDLVLRRVAGALRSIIRAGDAAIRLGGEEFLLVLRDADHQAAERVAMEFRNQLTNLPLPRSCLPRTRLTASIGIAVFPTHASNLHKLVRAADVAMYAAKRAGRDSHQVYTLPVPAAGAGRGRSIDGAA